MNTQDENLAKRLVGRFAYFLSGIAELAVALMMLHIVANILLFAFFRTEIEGTIDTVANVYMVAIAFLPLALVEASDGQLRVDVLADRFGERGQAALRFSARFLTMIVGFVLAYYTGKLALDATRIRESLELTSWLLPVWPVRWVFPIGFASMALIAMLSLPDQVRAKKS